MKADTGAMGGTGSEEFMVESPVGDDTSFFAPHVAMQPILKKQVVPDADMSLVKPIKLSKKLIHQM